MPGARWKPAYDLHFASARGQIRVETAAAVEQATGEDWTDVTLLLSTAIPGRGNRRARAADLDAGRAERVRAAAAGAPGATRRAAAAGAAAPGGGRAGGGGAS